jgi:hypothetical protein
MKKIFLLHAFIGLVALHTEAQDLSTKEKADNLAKNVFSKSKHSKKEVGGVVVEKNKVIESTPVATTDLGFYAGNYWYHDLSYKIEIRVAADKSLMATLSVPGKPEVQLKNLVVQDAYFTAVRPLEDGSQETWEGVFINKSDDGNIEFGLGIKPSNPVQLTGGLQLTKFFFKKVSP